MGFDKNGQWVVDSGTDGYNWGGMTAEDFSGIGTTAPASTGLASYFGGLSSGVEGIGKYVSGLIGAPASVDMNGKYLPSTGIGGLAGLVGGIAGLADGYSKLFGAEHDYNKAAIENANLKNKAAQWALAEKQQFRDNINKSGFGQA